MKTSGDGGVLVMNGEEYLDITALSTLFKIPVKTIYRWQSTGYGPKALKLGKHLRWARSNVDRWYAEQLAAQHAA